MNKHWNTVMTNLINQAESLGFSIAVSEYVVLEGDYFAHAKDPMNTADRKSTHIEASAKGFTAEPHPKYIEENL